MFRSERGKLGKLGLAARSIDGGRLGFGVAQLWQIFAQI